MKVAIKIDDQEVRKALNGLIELGRDMSPAMRSIASALESGVKDSFRSQRSPDGEAWPDLADSTKAKRAQRRKWPGQILRDSGDLAGSIHSRYSRDHAVGLNPFCIRARVRT